MSNVLRLIGIADPNFLYFSGATTQASNAMDVAGGSSHTLYAKVIAFDGPAPATVTASTGDSLTKIAESPNGRASIWAKAGCTAGSGVIVTATWSASQSGRSVQIFEIAGQPSTLDVLDTAAFSIAAGSTLGTFADLTNATGTTSAVVVMASWSQQNQNYMFFREYLSQHHYLSIGGAPDSLAQGAVWIAANTRFANTNIEAVYPDTAGAKEACAVVLNGTDVTAELAILENGRGAPWIASGELQASGDALAANIATGGWLATDSGTGFALYCKDAAYIDRLTVDMQANARSLSAAFRLRHEGGVVLNSHVPIAPGETGWLTGTSDSIDYVPAGSYIRGFFDNFEDGGLGAQVGRIAAATLRFTPADGLSTISKFVTGTTTTIDASATHFGILGQLATSSALAGSTLDYRVGEDCTAQTIALYISANSRSTTTRIPLVVNDSDSSTLYVDVPAGATGYMNSGALTHALLDQDRIRYRAAFGAGSGSIDIRSCQVDLVTTNRKIFGGLGQQGRSFGAGTRQYPLCGLNDSLSFGYSQNSRVVAPCRLTKLDVKVIATDAGGTLEVYRDGIATGFKVTIAAGASGWQSTTGNLLVSQNDIDFNRLHLILTSNGTQLDYSVISWAAELLSSPIPDDGVIGPFVWVKFPRRLP